MVREAGFDFLEKDYCKELYYYEEDRNLCYFDFASQYLNRYRLDRAKDEFNEYYYLEICELMTPRMKKKQHLDPKISCYNNLFEYLESIDKNSAVLTREDCEGIANEQESYDKERLDEIWEKKSRMEKALQPKIEPDRSGYLKECISFVK